MPTELLDWMIRSTIATTVAISIILALRPLWLRALGAATVLRLWWLLPAALLAVTLPAPSSPNVMQLQAALDVTVPTFTATDMPPRAASTASSLIGDAQPALALNLWLAGSLALALRLALQQRAFRRRTGHLRRCPDGSLRSARTDVGPAVIGALRPRILLPEDFESRYTPLQQRLVLAHERIHLHRGDLHVNLLFCVLRCLQWFNPLVHVAAARLRFDQELACDATVLRDHPSARRAYAHAMLNTELASFGPPLGCHWQSTHPLKRRIAMLKQPAPGPARRAVGSVLTLAVTLTLGAAAWAAQPPRPPVPLDHPPPVPEADSPAIAPVVDAASVPRASAPPAPSAPVAAEPAERPAPAPPAQPRPATPPTVPAPAPDADAQDDRLAARRRTPTAVATPSLSADDRTTPAPAPPAAVTTDDAGALFEPPRLLQSRDPVQPWRGRTVRNRYGTVVIRATVDREGAVSEASVERSEVDKAVERAALRALTEWRFEPARVDGRAVAATVIIPIRLEPPSRAALFDDRVPHPRPSGAIDTRGNYRPGEI